MADLVNVTEAARRLGVSRTKVWAMVRAGELEAHDDPIDKRQRLISIDAIAALVGRRRAPRKLPRTIGIVADGTVQSDEIEAFMRAHWSPE